VPDAITIRAPAFAVSFTAADNSLTSETLTVFLSTVASFLHEKKNSEADKKKVV
jgi:hypothetical protein